MPCCLEIQMTDFQPIFHTFTITEKITNQCFPSTLPGEAKSSLITENLFLPYFSTLLEIWIVLLFGLGLGFHQPARKHTLHVWDLKTCLVIQQWRTFTTPRCFHDAESPSPQPLARKTHWQCWIEHRASWQQVTGKASGKALQKYSCLLKGRLARNTHWLHILRSEMKASGYAKDRTTAFSYQYPSVLYI